MTADKPYVNLEDSQEGYITDTVAAGIRPTDTLDIKNISDIYQGMSLRCYTRHTTIHLQNHHIMQMNWTTIQSNIACKWIELVYQQKFDYHI